MEIYKQCTCTIINYKAYYAKTKGYTKQQQPECSPECGHFIDKKIQLNNHNSSNHDSKLKEIDYLKKKKMCAICKTFGHDYTYILLS